MQRSEIQPEDLKVLPVDLWHKKWLLLAAGDFRSGDWNCMTVGWGGLGVMWNKPLAMIVVRPTRYTYEVMEKSGGFTLCAFPEAFRKKLSWCGSHSGRDGSKARETGFTPIVSRFVAAPSFDEAELILECRKSYFADLDPARFLDPSTETHYPKKDYHRIYFGEIAAVSGSTEYAR